MGWVWDQLSGAQAKQDSLDILAQKYPAERGLSAETAEAVDDGELEIVDDTRDDQAPPPVP